MVHIPYDVWLLIIRSLPEETVQGLLSLDRVCFDTAMDARYREVRLESNVKEAYRYFHRLQDPSIARRVRILHVSSTIFLPHQQTSEVQHRGLFRKMADALLNKVPERPPMVLNFRTTSEAADALAHTFAEMSGVVKLHLTCMDGYDHPISLLSTIWTAFRSNLQHLSLNGSPRAVAHALGHLVVFEKLKGLALRFCMPSVDHPSAPAQATSRLIVSFVNGHHATLQDFELTSKYEFGPHSHASLVLDGLGHFLCLKFITLDALLDRSGPGLAALRNIIDMHQRQLTTLIITYPLPATFWEGATLPILNSLNVWMDASDPRMIEAVIALLNRLEPSLVGFKLNADYQLSYQELRNILGVFTQHSKLRRLTVPLEYLSSQALELVAKELPKLQLKLTNSRFMR